MFISEECHKLVTRLTQTPAARDNKQQIQPTYDARPGIYNPAHIGGGPSSYHCANPDLPPPLLPSSHHN